MLHKILSCLKEPIFANLMSLLLEWLNRYCTTITFELLSLRLDRIACTNVSIHLSGAVDIQAASFAIVLDVIRLAVDTQQFSLDGLNTQIGYGPPMFNNPARMYFAPAASRSNLGLPLGGETTYFQCASQLIAPY